MSKENLYKKSISLSKEEWEQIAETLVVIAPIVQSVLLKINLDGNGEQDVEDFLIDMQLAHAAVMYVAEFAADKCRVICEKDV